MSKVKVVDKVDGLMSNPKRVISWAIVVAVVVILFFVFKSKIMSLFSQVQKEADDKKAIEEAIAETGKQPSYSDAQYRIFAGQLYSAMEGWGTNEDQIYNVFKQMKSRVDVLKLIDAFGVKDGEDLLQWLNGDLSSWNFTKINQILRDNNVDYSF